MYVIFRSQSTACPPCGILLYNEIMKEDIFCAVFASFGTFLIYLFGGFDVAMQSLLIAIVLDYVSGLIKAYNNKVFSSKIGFRGIVKKLGVLVLVMIAVVVDRITGESGAIRTLIIYYFVANEGLSIIENLGEAGLPIPKVLKNALKNLKKENDK